MAGANAVFSYGGVALFVAALLLAAVSNGKAGWISRAAPFLLLAAGVLNILSGGPAARHLLSALLGLALGGLPLLILAVLQVTVGGGNVRLAASAGFALGWLGSYLALLAALLASVLFAAFYRPRRGAGKPARALPFTPFYAAAGIGALVLPVILKIG